MVSILEGKGLWWSDDQVTDGESQSSRDMWCWSTPNHSTHRKRKQVSGKKTEVFYEAGSATSERKSSRQKSSKESPRKGHQRNANGARPGTHLMPSQRAWVGERQCVNSTPHLARVTHANFLACGSSGVHASQLATQPSSQAKFMSHAQCTWLDRILLPPPSLLYLLNGTIPCDPQHGVQFGRLPEQSSTAGYEAQR